MDSGSGYIPPAPILLSKGPWKQIPGGVTAAKGFKAAGIYGGLHAKGDKPDLALVTCDVDAIAAGVFTTDIVPAAPIAYCKHVVRASDTARAVLINAGQANAGTGLVGYQDAVECANAVTELLRLSPNAVLIQSTGVVGQRIKKKALLNSLPKLVGSLSSTVEGADSAAVAITTTDLVSKSVAVECEVGGTPIRVGGMAKGSGMIHPNMSTMLGVVTTDALVTSNIWKEMVQTSVNKSFNQIIVLKVDRDTSTNSSVIALASGISGSPKISSCDSCEGRQLQACLDAVMQGLAKSIAWDGKGATCLMEVTVAGAKNEVEAARCAHSIASSILVKEAIYQKDPSWGRIVCAVVSAGIRFNLKDLHISLGSIALMRNGQPLEFDRESAIIYLKLAGVIHGTIDIHVSVGNGLRSATAWGCDLSYEYATFREYATRRQQEIQEERN